MADQHFDDIPEVDDFSPVILPERQRKKMLVDAPAGFNPFYVSSAGIKWYRRENNDGTTTYCINEDVEQILDQNKAEATHNDGWMDEKWGRRCASIPLAVWLKWKVEEGWDAFDPACADKLKQKLNDPDWMYLRTAHWRV